MTMTNQSESNCNLIKIIFGSDFHFGHPGRDQDQMAHAFASVVFNQLDDTDIFFINGDFFDRLVSFDHPSFVPIYEVIMSLFQLCERYQVKLRLMQGTWEHDRNQCKRFETFYRKGNFTFDFRYASTIELEEITIKDRTLRVFYVPDDLPFPTSDAIVDVLMTKLHERGWDQVDYGCMHGFFDFTFPANVSTEGRIVFRGDQFPFVKKIIDVGHVHDYRDNGANIISNGSFDRTVYGDEAPKGLIKIIDCPDNYTATFLENHEAARFETVSFHPDDTTDVLRQKVTERLNSLPQNVAHFVRCLVAKDDQRHALDAWLRETYPQVGRKFKTIADPTLSAQLLPASDLFTPVEKRIAPTKATISTLVRDFIPDTYSLSVGDIQSYLGLSDVEMST